MTDATGTASDPCQAVLNAKVAQAKVPFSSQNTVTQRGATMRSEARHVGDKSYFHIDGAWRSAPLTTEQMINELAQARQNSKHRCRVAADETVQGEPAAVFEVHVTADGTTTDSKFWVSKRSGLPLQAQTIIDARQTVEQTFNYVGIKTPVETPS